MMNNINDDLDNLSKYLYDNSMVINARKSKFMIIRNRNVDRTYDNNFNIMLNNTC